MIWTFERSRSKRISSTSSLMGEVRLDLGADLGGEELAVKAGIKTRLLLANMKERERERDAPVAQTRLAYQQPVELLALRDDGVEMKRSGTAEGVAQRVAEEATEAVLGVVATAERKSVSIALGEPHHHVALPRDQTALSKIHLNVGEDTQGVEVSLDLEQPAAADGLSLLETDGAVQHPGTGDLLAPHHDPPHYRLRALEDVKDDVGRLVLGNLSRDQDLIKASVTVESANSVSCLLDTCGVERPTLAQR
jgi:hypothetical protein